MTPGLAQSLALADIHLEEATFFTNLVKHSNLVMRHRMFQNPVKFE